MMRATQAEIDKIVAESYEKRDQELDEQIQELDQSMRKADKDHARLLRRLKRNEKVKRVCDKIKAARTQGQAQVKIPSPPSSDPKTCIEKQIINILST